MPRPPALVALAAVLAAVLAACSPRADLAPDEAYRAAQAALDAGDASRALALYGVAADAGRLDALAMLAEARRRGYFNVSAGPPDPAGARHLPVRSWPGQAARAERAYAAALRDSARAGHPDALARVAGRLLDRSWDGEAWRDPTEADRDSARAIYRRLDAEGADPLRLYSLAWSLDDEAGARRHLRDADADGHPQACAILYWVGGGHDASTPEGLRDYLDHLLACPGPGGAGPEEAAEVVRALAAQADAGNAAAADLLAGLRETGVFERYPRLAPLAARPAPAPSRGGADRVRP